MKNLKNLKYLVAMLAMFLTFGTIDGLAQRRKPVIRRKTTTNRRVTPKPVARLYTVSSGEKFRVRLNDALSSKTSKVGDKFTVNVTEPVYSDNGVIVIPVGSVITGRVDTVQAARNEGKPGSMDVSFVELKLPNGTRRVINGSLTDLTTKDGKSDSEGTVAGDKTKNRKLIFIGGGAGGGALLGAAVGGGKGALIGGIIGAGAGYLGDRFTKGENVDVKPGTDLGVYLNQSISLPKFTESNL